MASFSRLAPSCVAAPAHPTSTPSTLFAAVASLSGCVLLVLLLAGSGRYFHFVRTSHVTGAPSTWLAGPRLTYQSAVPFPRAEHPVPRHLGQTPLAATRASASRASPFGAWHTVPLGWLALPTCVVAAVSFTFQRKVQMRQYSVGSLAGIPQQIGEPKGAPDAVPLALEPEREIRPGVFEGYWFWRGYRIRYQRSGTFGPALLLVHGFGANADHWRNNIGPLGQKARVYAIDLLGYGYSDKPAPCKVNINALYNFEAWGRQCADFIEAKFGEPTFVVTNSVGGVTGMQAALDAPHLVRGVILMNVSLRMLHETKQPKFAKPLVKAFQNTLRTTSLGKYFFENLATPKTLKNVLRQAYSNPATVTDELVDIMLKPGLQPGAVEVFLDFISYSSGPLPELQLQQLQCPVRIIWGEDDPWEKIEWGRKFQKFPCVEDFIALPGVGHCPHDEAPGQVNPLIEEFVAKHSVTSLAV